MTILLTKTSQKNIFSRKHFRMLGNIGTFNDQQMYEQAPEGEEYETFYREDRAEMTPDGNGQLVIDL